MKNKISFIIFSLFIYFCLPSQVYSSPVCCGYRYFSLGTGPVVFIPNVGIGYRERHLQHGWDGSLSFSTIGYGHQFSGNLVSHHYLTPLQTSPYLGFGALGSVVITNDDEGGCTLSPDFVFGKEFEKSDSYRHFIEMHVAIPTLWVDGRAAVPFYFPLTYVKYGLSF